VNNFTYLSIAVIAIAVYFSVEKYVDSRVQVSALNRGCSQVMEPSPNGYPPQILWKCPDKQ